MGMAPDTDTQLRGHFTCEPLSPRAARTRVGRLGPCDLPARRCLLYRPGHRGTSERTSPRSKGSVAVLGRRTPEAKATVPRPVPPPTPHRLPF